MSFIEPFSKIKKFCLDFLFPIECLGCGKEGVWLCEKCFNKFPLKYTLNCPICHRPTIDAKPCLECKDKSYLDRLYLASDYQNALLKQVIHIFKYKYVFDLAKPLGELLVKFLKQNLTELFNKEIEVDLDLGKNIFELNDDDLNKVKFESPYILIPVPLHSRRKRERGFNQAELLAREVSQNFAWPIRADILIRTRYTRPQVKLKEQERNKNIQNAFKYIGNYEEIKNKIIILVDDVVTTGSTMQEAARVLKLAGIQEVWGLALARG